MSAEHPSVIVASVIPVGTLTGVPATLGAVGYAAFALLQPIPLSEVVPFQTVVAAFEAEAARLVPPVGFPEDGSGPAIQPLPAPEPDPQPDPQPGPEPTVVFTEGGYRPATYAEGGYAVAEAWDADHLALTPAPVEQELQPVEEPVFDDLEVAALADDTMLREVVELARVTPPPEPAPEVAAPEVASPEVEPAMTSLTAGGYATNGASDDSRARQVLDELSFLFDE